LGLVELCLPNKRNMDTPPSPEPPAEISKKPALIIFGVGNAGISVAGQIFDNEIPAACFVAVDSDASALTASSAPLKIHLERRVLRGLGSGGDPQCGRELAEEHAEELRAVCSGQDLVFIVAGLGGGAGTGATPVLARLAKESGALVLAFVILPFDCEGSLSQETAQQGLEEIREVADGVICLPNQKLFGLIDENTSVQQAFQMGNGLMADCLRGLWRLILHKGLIEIHFNQLCDVLRGKGSESTFAVAEAAGATRSREVLDKLLAHPLLEGGQRLQECQAVLVSLVGGPDLTMAEVNRIMTEISGKCAGAQVIMGAATHELFRERLSVTLIAVEKSTECDQSSSLPRVPTEEFCSPFLKELANPRPASRFVPPPPELPPDQMQRMLAQQRGDSARARKGLPKLRQTQLPLEIISKGRFDKSEPTIHKGEDLDVPTYIRRGIALN
jgi:cell division protein FtsZ